ncbi:NADH dehydrogenase [ubiquinone] 1 alpha subcomplex subunit 6 [Tribolium castaneum]|uniref:NADH dehydrogenase [ubiquinone] 1 alpha subcomplex subunit 6 n=1 Tax=Tribolium castaneum TaxID=7070 RepID=D7EHX8_TRICA|nr:PREDICTED: NADH dehydrogenase [ubiquinone] 1 alpha subcomplex subunit 6 [Tribolium castaneum]KYB28574.1 NADH dehydrogenase [ubiquinone] 1 alpha subcomplex subunit 6-like Protein [Tribolium castaneum]|eukprot:XP_969319.1 PREDICTED: NADH dehydrogenase [ubiquinone] 1 alpha subcomplex subunit 6 [Tribolium castaneum]
MSQAVRAATKQVRPILSTDPHEARRRVLNLYKAWYRQIPYIVKQYDIPKSVDNLKAKLREEFRKNDHIKDIRLIDMLVVKGQMELKETVNFWKQKGTLMSYFKDTVEPKQKDFLSKFFSGH